MVGREVRKQVGIEVVGKEEDCWSGGKKKSDGEERRKEG